MMTRPTTPLSVAATIAATIGNAGADCSHRRFHHRGRMGRGSLARRSCWRDHRRCDCRLAAPEWLVVALRRRRSRFERDPSIVRKVRLDPCVRVAGRDDLLGGLTLRSNAARTRRCARSVARHESRGNAEASQHCPHCRCEVLAVPAVTAREEKDKRPDSGIGIRWWIKRVLKERRIAQVIFDGDRLVVRIADTRGPLHGQRAYRLRSSGAVIVELRVLAGPCRIVAACSAELRGCCRGDKCDGLQRCVAVRCWIELHRIDGQQLGLVGGTEGSERGAAEVDRIRLAGEWDQLLIPGGS